MQEFIAAIRQLRRPIAALAVAILVAQCLVAGLATAAAAARAAGFDAGILCHGNGDGPSDQAPTSNAPAHDCCVYCTAAAPAVLIPTSSSAVRLDLFQNSVPPDVRVHVFLTSRAIRAGPSQAPPAIA